MGEKLKFSSPPTTLEEENKLLADRNTYLLEYIKEHLDTDLLTDLKNRKTFESELEKSLKAIRAEAERLKSNNPEPLKRSGSEPLRQLAVIFIDLDNFKQVNDMRGHQEGDEVLKKVAKILKESVRESDLVARFGGDEFYILLPRADEMSGKAIADKILMNIEEDSVLNEFGISASIGVSSADVLNLVRSTDLIAHADEAMYAAKKAGKNRVEVYT